MHVTETTLQGLISGTKQFRVPLFQRPYKWTEREHQQLWRDILRQYEATRTGGATAGHFIGSFVLAPAPSNAVVPAYLVVDGQQRLTTLSLAICALRDAAASADPNAHDRFTNQYLENAYAVGDLRWKLVPTQDDRPSYFACVRGQPRDDANAITAAYRFFAVKLAELDDDGEPLDINLLESVIVTRLAIVDITAQSSDNVHRIFESLNGTGIGLTQADLLRNYLFMLLPTRGQLVYDEVWKDMQERLGPDNLVGLARVDLRRRGIDVRDDDVYRAQQDRIADLEPDEAAVEAEVRDLALRAWHYGCILDPEREPNHEIRRRLVFLHRWKATTTHPVLMYLYGEREAGRITDADMVEALGYLESFLVRRLLVGTPSNSLSGIFLQLVGQLRQPRKGPVADELRSFLSAGRRFWATDDEIRAAALQRPFFLHGRALQRRLVLERLEESFGHKEQVDLAALSLSVEHVMPQTLSAEWAATLDGGEPPESVHRALVHCVGNLTLTAYNSELSNNPFERKQQIYDHSHLSLNRSLLDTPTWGRAEIEARAAALAGRTVTMWPGPTPGAADAGTGDHFDWSRMRATIAAIPPGRWTTYVDLAGLVGTVARAVGNHIATHPALPGAWRVLTATGSISEGFRWADPEDVRDPREVLEREGVCFDAEGLADDGQRLRTDALHDLFSRYDGIDEDPEGADRPSDNGDTADSPEPLAAAGAVSEP